MTWWSSTDRGWLCVRRTTVRVRPPAVLVVDDDDEMRAMLRRTLEADGYQVTERDRGTHVLETLRGAVVRSDHPGQGDARAHRPRSPADAASRFPARARRARDRVRRPAGRGERACGSARPAISRSPSGSRSSATPSTASSRGQETSPGRTDRRSRAETPRRERGEASLGRWWRAPAVRCWTRSGDPARVRRGAVGAAPGWRGVPHRRRSRARPVHRRRPGHEGPRRLPPEGATASRRSPCSVRPASRPS